MTCNGWRRWGAAWGTACWVATSGCVVAVSGCVVAASGCAVAAGEPTGAGGKGDRYEGGLDDEPNAGEAQVAAIAGGLSIEVDGGRLELTEAAELGGDAVAGAFFFRVRPASGDDVTFLVERLDADDPRLADVEPDDLPDGSMGVLAFHALDGRDAREALASIEPLLRETRVALGEEGLSASLVASLDIPATCRDALDATVSSVMDCALAGVFGAITGGAIGLTGGPVLAVALVSAGVGGVIGFGACWIELDDVGARRWQTASWAECAADVLPDDDDARTTVCTGELGAMSYVHCRECGDAHEQCADASTDAATFARDSIAQLRDDCCRGDDWTCPGSGELLDVRHHNECGTNTF